jgi:hypothetical protein
MNIKDIKKPYMVNIGIDAHAYGTKIHQIMPSEISNLKAHWVSVELLSNDWLSWVYPI